jgi:hypothetical protein
MPLSWHARRPIHFLFPAPKHVGGGVRAGDLVKLVFEWELPFEKYVAERMWVRITNVEGDALEGVLDNTPTETGRLQPGDLVRFSPVNIVSINWADPRPLISEPSSREYWERCLVDQCVLDGIEPVEYLYREKPDMAQEGDKFPDSGWRVRGRQGAATDQDMEARKFQYVAIAAVLNRDDSWLHLIDEAIGSAFMRNFATGQYERCRDE